MYSGIKLFKNYSGDNDYHILLDYKTGEVISLGNNFYEEYSTDCKNTCFESIFSQFDYQEVKQKIDTNNGEIVILDLKVNNLEIPFKFEKLELEDKEYVYANILTESIFFDSLADKFDFIRRSDLFLTAHIDKDFKIVACSKRYKAMFEHSTEQIIGKHLFHNVITYKPDFNSEMLAEIIEDNFFWYGVEVLKEKNNIYEPYIVLAYNRKVPIIDAEYEFHFFPLRDFGNKNIFHYDFHSENNTIYLRTIFEGIVHKYLNSDDNNKYLLFMDINNFKSINDSYGHDYGDQVLKTLSMILGDVFKEFVVSRYGGDEFAVYIDREISKEEILKLISEVEHRIETKIGDKFNDCKTHLSFGVSKYKENGTTLNELIHAADMAMYRAKRKKSLCEFCYE